MLSLPPQVSVIMAVYNAPPQYLQLAVTSILRQTLADFEFIIIDDGSNSATHAELQVFAACDSRIVLSTLSENIGLTRALNIGLGLARGAYIARQDADDVSMPTRLAASVTFMDKNPDVAAAGTYAQLMGRAGEPFRVIESDLRLLQKRNVLVHGSMIFRKDCLNRVGGYNESMRLSQDYEVYLRMVRLHSMRLAVVPKPLYMLRQHAGSLSSRRMFRQLYFSVMAKTLTLPPCSAWRRKIVFFKIYVFDFIVTHHMLLGPMVRNAFHVLRNDYPDGGR
jgi:glycosyltransferase involved in cell wall biosynthesis